MQLGMLVDFAWPEKIGRQSLSHCQLNSLVDLYFFESEGSSTPTTVGGITNMYTIFFVKTLRRMRVTRAPPHIGTRNDLRVAHDISFCV